MRGYDDPVADDPTSPAATTQRPGPPPILGAGACPECGRSVRDYLTLAEAADRGRVANSACRHCRLTDVRR